MSFSLNVRIDLLFPTRYHMMVFEFFEKSIFLAAPAPTPNIVSHNILRNIAKNLGQKTFFSPNSTHIYIPVGWFCPQPPNRNRVKLLGSLQRLSKTIQNSPKKISPKNSKTIRNFLKLLGSLRKIPWNLKKSPNISRTLRKPPKICKNYLVIIENKKCVGPWAYHT